MNPSAWTYPLPNFYSPGTPSHAYAYTGYRSPLPGGSIYPNHSLDFSSGYESGSRETSLIDSSYLSPNSVFKSIHLPRSSQCLESHNDSGMDDDIDEVSDSNQRKANGEPCSKKRRVLSRPQRQEANRRERQRMEIINHAYEELRNVLPFKKGRKRQRMSRMDTVEGAIRYINSLLEILNEPNSQLVWN